MQTQHHQTGEEPLAPPQGHVDPQGGGQQPVGGAGDGVGVEQVLPHHGQGPLWHDVGEDEDGAQVLAPGQVGAGDQKGEQAAVEDGDHAGARRQPQGIQQRRPQVGPGQAAGEQVDVVDQGIAAGLAGEVGVDGAGVDLEGVLHNGHDGSHGGDGKHNAHQQQDDVVGLGEKGPELIEQDGRPAGGPGGRRIHRAFLLRGSWKKRRPWMRYRTPIQGRSCLMGRRRSPWFSRRCTWSASRSSYPR